MVAWYKAVRVIRSAPHEEAHPKKRMLESEKKCEGERENQRHL